MANRRPYNPKARTWKLYGNPDGSFFLQTYSQGPTVRQCPAALSGFLAQRDPVAFTTYAGSKSGSITTYLLRASAEDLVRASRSKAYGLELRTAPELPPETDADYNITTKHTPLDGLAGMLAAAIRHDVVEFCNEKPAKAKTSSGRSLVERIVPESVFTILQPGQHDLVKDGKGKYTDRCILDIGIDFSKGCVATITSDGRYDPSQKCDYCYAYQSGVAFTETCYQFDEQTLYDSILAKAKQRDINGAIMIRLGHTTDANMPRAIRQMTGAPDSLRTALRAIGRLAKERPVAVAMPTKFPQYDDDLARLMIDANVSLLVSIAYERLEPGVVAHGFTLERRLDEALRFARADVNTNLYVATDITRPMSEMQPEAKRALEFYREHHPLLGLQWLDMRITKKGHAELVGGAHWRDLKSRGQPGLFGTGEGRWQSTGQNYLAAAHTHPDFLDIIGNNTGRMRMCSTHVQEDEQRCGQCFMKAARR